MNGTPEDDIAALAVYDASIVVAVAHSDGHDVLGPTRSSSSPGGEPENDEKAIDDEDGEDAVRAAQAGDLFGQDDVGDCKPGKERLDDVRKGFGGERMLRTYDGEGEAFFVEVGVVHQAAAEADDDEGDEELETADDGDPEGSVEDVIAPGLFHRLLHCE